MTIDRITSDVETAAEPNAPAVGPGKPRKRRPIASSSSVVNNLNGQRRDPPPHMRRGPGEGAPPGGWTAGDDGLPIEDPCPVVPLGAEGDHFHVLDSIGQLRSFADSKLTHAMIQGLFAAAPNWPQWAFPRYGASGKKSEPPPIKSFHDDGVRQALFGARARKGLFSPRNKVRGRGAWRRADGRLIYHSGDRLWTGDGDIKSINTGLLDGLVYPQRPPVPAPWTKPFPWQETLPVP
jgi:hypothetical protein